MIRMYKCDQEVPTGEFIYTKQTGWPSVFTKKKCLYKHEYILKSLDLPRNIFWAVSRSRNTYIYYLFKKKNIFYTFVRLCPALSDFPEEVPTREGNLNLLWQKIKIRSNWCELMLENLFNMGYLYKMVAQNMLCTCN